MRQILRTGAVTASVLSLLLFPGARPAAADDGLVVPQPGMVITADTTFAPGTYDFSSGKGITIAADGVTVNGNGAVLQGPGTAGNKDSFAGTGVLAEGVSGVALTGLAVKGFQVGLHVRSGQHWTISQNDFSGNYTDPDFGWGDGPLYGAVLLEHVSGSTVTGNTGRENWNGLALHYSDGNTVTGNDFSHCSNVCLKMWSASRNHIEDNNFSYGIRIAPGETHARDSTSALLETASNDNRIVGNDFTYGGDGVFLRPLNGVVSTGNHFEGNDASYAHNNAWESWSPGNTFVRNRGNYSSYGFWLGGSDNTVLIDNEAAFNGTVNHNAPEPFGNAGIAIVKGSASHIVLDGNRIHDNTSVGLALGYQQGYEVQHWIVQRNQIVDNATYGIFMRDARWIDLAGNDLHGNGSGDVQRGANVSDVVTRDVPAGDRAPQARVAQTPHTVYAGQAVTFDATGSTDEDGDSLRYRWDLGDGEMSTDGKVVHRYVDPGYYRVGVTVNDGGLADIGHIDLYVRENGDETGTEGTGGWQATVKPTPLGWSVDSAAPDHGTNPSLASGAGPNLDRGIIREVTVPSASPTLAFESYWDVEAQYDYGFVQISDDGGKTWHSLGNGDTTATAASDSIGTVQENLPGFNGASGGWRHEEFDLTPYAGKNVLLMLRYVTDGGVDKPGWWVDDLTLGGTTLSDGSTLQGWSVFDPDAGDGQTVAVSADDTHRIEGDASVRLHGNAKAALLTYRPSQALDISKRDRLEMWLSFAHETRDGFQGNQPVIRLMQDGDNYLEFTPGRNYLSPWSLPYNEARDGWQRLSVPLAGSRTWNRTVVGSPAPNAIRSVQVELTSIRGPYQLWLDSLKFVTTPPAPDIAPNMARNPDGGGAPAPIASVSFPGDWGLAEYDNDWAPLNGSVDDGRLWSSFNSGHDTDWYGVEFGTAREVNQVRVTFVGQDDKLAAPTDYVVEYFTDGAWHRAESPKATPDKPALGRNVVTFDPVVATKVRVVVTNPTPTMGTGTYVGISEFAVHDTANLAGNRLGATAPFGTPVPTVSAGNGDAWAMLDGSLRADSAWRSGDGEASVAVDLVRRHPIDTVSVYLASGAGAALPAKIQAQYWTGSSWADVAHVRALPSQPTAGRNTLSFDTVTARKLRVVLTASEAGPVEVREFEVGDSNLLSGGSTLGLQITPSASYTFSGDTVWGPLDDSYARSPRWTSWNSHNKQDWYAVSLDRPVTAGRIDLYFYNDRGGVQPPTEYRIEYWDGSAWKAVTERERDPGTPQEGFNTVVFDQVRSDKFRVVGTNRNPVNFGVYIGLTEFEVYRWDR